MAEWGSTRVPYRLASPDRRSARTVLSARIATRRLVVLFCVAVMLVALVVRYPHAFRDANGPPVRTPRSTTSTARSAGATRSSPTSDRDRGARSDPGGRDVRRRRGRSPARLDRARARVGRATCGTSSCRADWIRTRRGSSASPATAAPIPARARSGRARRPRDPAANVVTLGAIAGLAALNVAYAALGCRCSGRSGGWRAGRTSCGSPGSGTSSASPRSASSGRRSSSSASVRRLGRRALAHWRHQAAAGVGVVFGRPLPRGYGDPNKHASSDAVLVSAGGVALTGLLLEALFRSARLQSLQAYDAWAFWVPKAKAIYFFGGLDAQVFTTFPGPTYPPLIPILDAAAFHAMGGVDVVTLHLQYWFLVVGAVAAVAGSSTGRYRHGCSGLRSCSSSPCRACGGTAGASGGRARRLPVRRRRAPARALAAATGGTGVSPRSPCCSPVRG